MALCNENGQRDVPLIILLIWLCIAVALGTEQRFPTAVWNDIDMIIANEIESPIILSDDGRSASADALSKVESGVTSSDDTLSPEYNDGATFDAVEEDESTRDKDNSSALAPDTTTGIVDDTVDAGDPVDAGANDTAETIRESEDVKDNSSVKDGKRKKIRKGSQIVKSIDEDSAKVGKVGKEQKAINGKVTKIGKWMKGKLSKVSLGSKDKNKVEPAEGDLDNGENSDTETDTKGTDIDTTAAETPDKESQDKDVVEEVKKGNDDKLSGAEDSEEANAGSRKNAKAESPEGAYNTDLPAVLQNLQQCCLAAKELMDKSRSLIIVIIPTGFGVCCCIGFLTVVVVTAILEAILVSVLYPYFCIRFVSVFVAVFCLFHSPLVVLARG